MTALTKTRIEAIDLLKGLVMVIMALDHVRDYFHYDSFFFDPGNPMRTTLPIFFTRWITHFCAPAFSFLAGVSAFMVGKRKTPAELSGWLIKRGIWLVFVEFTLVGFAWYFDVHFTTLGLLVIWSLGISMLLLAAIIHLPRNLILILCLLLIGGHNLLDGVHFPGNVLWSILHESAIYHLPESRVLVVHYPIIPWVAVMALGYYLGAWYDKSFDSIKRKQYFNRIGIAAIVLFVILRFTNLYGDSRPFIQYETFSQDIISFLNPSKYPPSFLYVLMTLGATLLFLANAETWKGKVVDFFCTFGRVPFFYYILHLYVIHILAMLVAQATGWDWHTFFLSTWVGQEPALKGFGFGLIGVYTVWISVILILYPLCKRFDMYKQAHKEKWWLSYL